MSNKRINIATFLTLPLAEQVGNLDTKQFGKDEDATCGAWFDWFCTDKSLTTRGKSLVSKLKSIQHSKRFNPETTYTFFKNNCPCVGNLYDDFRICDIETGNVIFCIVPKSGHTSMNGLGEVWGKDAYGQFGALFKGTWKEIKNWFNNFS